MKYRLVINGALYFPESSERLKNLLDFARGQVYADLSLTQIHHRKPKFTTKLLAWIFRWDLALLNEGSKMTALINGNRAIAHFHEEIDVARFNEQPDLDISSFSFNSINPDYVQGDNGEVEFLVDGSDHVRHPERKCAATDKVMNAFLSFYKTGVRPDCIDWEKVDWDTAVDTDM